VPCENTIEAYRPANGGPLRFTQPRDGRAYTRIDLPCGQCILCRLEHARQWAVRITHEAQLHTESSFVTLTYDDEHLPPHNGLNYADLQKFWKRLRKAIGPLRYYAVGEYGDQTHRPHYHACIFGHAFTANRTIVRQQPTLLWTNPVLEAAWGLGHVSVGALTFQTAQYTASYVTKKLNNKRRYVRLDEETGELVPLVQPRAFMSLRPAVAKTWLSRFGKQIYHHDQVVIEGRPQKPPKYYDKWLASTAPERAEQIKEKRKEQSQKLSTEQAHARAENARARGKMRTKTV
jgi:hypothetical protein